MLICPVFSHRNPLKYIVAWMPPWNLSVKWTPKCSSKLLDTVGICNSDSSGFWMGSEIWKPNYLKSGHTAAILSKNFWNLDIIVRILNVPDFIWSDHSLSYNQTLWKPNHLAFIKSPDFEWLDCRSPLFFTFDNFTKWALCFFIILDWYQFFNLFYK